MDLYTFLLLIGLIALFVVMEYFRDRKYWNRIDRLLDRIQAKDFEQFQYFQNQYKQELVDYRKQMNRLEREAEKEEKEDFIQTGKQGKDVITPEVLEEDWSEEELKEVKEQV